MFPEPRDIQSWGVAILFNKNIEYTIHSKHIYNKGNFIVLDLTIEENCLLSLTE
jgi:hypothetical protein